MHIDSYTFGEIIIDGKRFTKDLVILKSEMKEDWWRAQGHLLQWEDLQDIVKARPDILIVGTGESGMMKIAEDVTPMLADAGIRLFSYKTGEAVKLFNRMQDKNVAAAFHLTC